MNPEEPGETPAQERENAPDPIVRPIGYVPDEPVIRRIGDRELYLGSGLAAHPEYHNRTFEYVLSATRDERPRTTHHHPLHDGPDTDWSAFEAAVETARQLYKREGTLLIHCKAGISRSSALSATVIAAEENRPFSDALAVVQETRLHAVPHPALHELAVVYLAAHS